MTYQGNLVIFAIHQSKNNPKVYLFTRERDDLSMVPEGILEQLGKIQFLRNSREPAHETDIISLRHKEIVARIAADGYCVLKL